MLQVFDVIDSTNTEALRQLDSCSDFSLLHKKVIYAKQQTAGRGRMNRAFFSPESGAYFSLVYTFPEGAPENFDPAVYTACAATGVCRAIEKLYGTETSIKWVNDIYCRGKKVCGILAEGKINLSLQKIGAVVVGIGVNIFTPEEKFPEEIRERAGSVLLESDGSDPLELVKEASKEIFAVYDNPEKIPEAMEYYCKKSNLIGKTVTVTPVINMAEGRYDAQVTGVSEDARLIVKLESGEIRRLSSGEVSLHV